MTHAWPKMEGLVCNFADVWQYLRACNIILTELGGLKGEGSGIALNLLSPFHDPLR